MGWALLAIFYALMAYVVWQGTRADNRARPAWLGPSPSPVLRGVFWLPLMLWAIVCLAGDLLLEAGAVRDRKG